MQSKHVLITAAVVVKWKQQCFANQEFSVSAKKALPLKTDKTRCWDLP